MPDAMNPAFGDVRTLTEATARAHGPQPTWWAAGAAAFGNADQLTVIARCAAPGVRFAREGMPTPPLKDQR